MKCNKCGTPIIPGENTCRICGNKTDFSERVKEPEIIDFPDDITGVSMDLPDLEAIVDVEVSEPVNNVEIKEEINPIVEDEIIDIVEPISNEEVVEDIQDFSMEQPIALEQLPTIDDVVDVEPEQVEVVEKEPVEVQEDAKTENKKVLDKANEKVEKPKKVEKEVKVKKEKKPSKFGVVLLTLLLLCSLGLNAYLYIMDGNTKASDNDENVETEEVYSKVSYGAYRITMPSNWITENSTNNLLVYDETQNWAASIKIINNVDFETLVTNKETLAQSLGNLKYQFTSHYSKLVDENEFYIFKGKYYDYSVYVIATSVNNTDMIVTDLKFKGEVDDILLNNVLQSMTQVKENNTTDLFKDNFEFQDINNEIITVSKKVEE